MPIQTFQCCTTGMVPGFVKRTQSIEQGQHFSRSGTGNIRSVSLKDSYVPISSMLIVFIVRGGKSAKSRKCILNSSRHL